MKFFDPESVKAITPQNPYGRSPDGRPRVPDELLERMKQVTTEEAWRVLYNAGYQYQFAGGWTTLHPERVMVGRALTATVVPLRPDLDAVVNGVGAQEGRVGTQNNWVIQSVVKGDVVVVDVFGKLRDGPFVGDNLSSAVQSRGGAGLVIEGAVRDVQRMINLPDINVYCRGFDPTPRKDITLVHMNGVTRIGEATCLPGDVVLGTRTGVLFIPPHMVEKILQFSEDTRIRDQFAQQRLAEGRYSTGQVDKFDWAPEIEADFREWKKTSK